MSHFIKKQSGEPDCFFCISILFLPGIQTVNSLTLTLKASALAEVGEDNLPAGSQSVPFAGWRRRQGSGCVERTNSAQPLAACAIRQFGMFQASGWKFSHGIPQTDGTWWMKIVEKCKK
ncbi:MAG: hypothetical protein LIO46_01530 [Clostridiales bacterium]|nr:hypothetical protein [Clostridiales bacterium]